MTATLDTIAEHIEAGEHAEAGRAIDATPETEDNREDLQFLRGYLKEQAYDRAGALAEYEAVLSRDPDHTNATFHAALLHSRVGEDAVAIELYERCAGGDSANVSALLNLAVLYEQEGRYAEAESCLNPILAEHPEHKRAYHYLKSVEASYNMVYDEATLRDWDQRHAVLDQPITDFELSVRSRNCLRQMNIRSIGDLLRITETELLAYKNFGETSLCEIKAMLKQKGLRLGQLLQPSAERPATVLPDAENGDAAAVTSQPVAELELSVRSRKCVQRLGITTIGDLIVRSEAELMATKNFGATSLAEIKRRLEAMGLALRPPS